MILVRICNQQVQETTYHFDALIPHSFPLTKKHIFTLHANIVCGGVKYFFFSNLPLEMIQFDEHIFQMGGSTTKN